MDIVNHTQENNFDIRGILPELHKLYLNYNDLLSSILKVDNGIDEGKAIEYAIAIIPRFLFDVFGILCPDKCQNDYADWCDRDLRNYFCFCINYNSHLYPNNRFHLHLLSDGIELKTFCYKKGDGTKPGIGLRPENIEKLYDKDSIFVVLLDLFYNHLGEFSNEFSMNKFLSLLKDNGGLVNLTYKNSQQEPDSDFNKSWYCVLKEENYTKHFYRGIEAVEEYLKNKTYGYISCNGEEYNYTNYAAFLMVAAGEQDQTLPSYPDYLKWGEEYALKWRRKRYSTTFSDQYPLRFRQYNIPILGFDENRTDKQESRKVIGNLMIPSLVEIDEYVLSFFYEITDDLLNKIWQFEKIVWARKAAVRAAIAQVMARNMSHNFGSHVLSNLINNNVYEQMEDGVVKGKLQKFISTFGDEPFKDNENHQLQYFFQYLKSRMDYLSEITLGISNLLSTKMVYTTVVKELDQVRVLLNHISGVNDFNYTFKLISEDGEKITVENDIGVAFPNDVLGCHAFYNIIENIIRNTAKHAKRKEGTSTPTVVFTIQFKDIEGCDDVEGSDELYCVEIDNGVQEENIAELVKSQNKRLNESVLEHDGRLRNRNLGLLEMEASAAFLRQIDLSDIESENYHIDEDNDKKFFYERNDKKRLNILKAFNKNGALGYRFFVQKPKEFLFVGDWDVDEILKKRLLNIGIQFIYEEKFILAMEEGKAFAHQFLLYANDGKNIEKIKVFLDKDNDCKTLLPLRKAPLEKKDWETISKYWTREKKQLDTSSNGIEEQANYSNGKDILQKLKEWVWEKSGWQGIIRIRPTVDKSCLDSQVVFLDHGKDEIHKEGCESLRQRTDIWIENVGGRTCGKLPEYYELLTKGIGDTPLKKYISAAKRKTMILQELFEAYNNKVIILDERVQKFAETSSEGAADTKNKLIPCWRLFRSTNVYIPRLPQFDDNGKTIDIEDWIGKTEQQSQIFSLDPNDSRELKDKVEYYVKEHLKDNINPYTRLFILVHYGILERIYDGKVKEINRILNDWAKKADRVVVTSGRGTHSLDLPKSVCFVNLSSVLYVCNENRNKYLINYLLNQSRRKRNE